MYECRIRRENTENRKVAVVLGGTIPHGTLLQKLRQRGYYTVLIDYFENPPAAVYADVHYQESAMDAEVVYQVAREMQADLVLSPCLDQQINIAMQVSERLGLPHPFSSELAEEVTNKKLMKKKMLECGVPTSRYYVVGENTPLDELNLSYPIIVKPVDSCGSAGVTRVDIPKKLMESVKSAISWSRDRKAIVEEYVEGTEMNVYCAVRDGAAEVLFASCKIVALQDILYQHLCTVYLPELQKSVKEGLTTIAKKITEGFGLPKNTPLFIQVIVNKKGISVIEFSPRIGGGVSSFVAEECAGFDYLGFSIDSYLNQPGACGNAKLKRYIAFLPIYCNEGVFMGLTGTTTLLSDGIISRVFMLKEPGDEVNMHKPSSSNVARIMIEGETLDECYRKMIQAKKVVEAIGMEGESITDRRFVLTKEMFDSKLSLLV